MSVGFLVSFVVLAHHTRSQGWRLIACITSGCARSTFEVWQASGRSRPRRLRLFGDQQLGAEAEGMGVADGTTGSGLFCQDLRTRQR